MSKSSILSLLTKCQTFGCGAAVNPDELVTVPDGAALHVRQTCADGHQNTWQSSEGISDKGRRVNVINIMLVAYIFLTGLHYGTFKVSFSWSKELKFTVYLLHIY